MNRHRTWLSVLLGAVLLAQGLAVSAAPHAATAAAGEADGTAMAHMMPCHGQSEPAPQAAPAGPCCDADCPDMSHCALGHLACTCAVSVIVPPPARAERGFAPAGVALRPPAALLRPPIIVHA